MRLDDVLRGDLCAGCGLCASIMGDGAAMGLDASGYLRPELARRPTPDEDRLIDAVCPGGLLELDPPLGQPVWGTVRRSATGHATDRSVRHGASSGGLLSAVAASLVQRGVVDYVVHTGAAIGEPWLNEGATSRSAEAVYRRVGSRYAPSAPLEGLLEALDEPGRFAVIGKPCDIAALRAYARRDPRVDRQVPVMLSFFCGGVPSARGVEELLSRMDAPSSDVQEFRFRGNGWPGRATAVLSDGTTRDMDYEHAWGSVLSRHVQRRCKVCPDGLGAFADLVFADAWFEDDKGGPSFEEREGRSLVLSRTLRGDEVLQGALDTGAIELQPYDVESLERIQPHQARRTRLTMSRTTALRMARRPAPRYRGLRLLEAARQAGAAANAKSLAGTLRRIHRRSL